MVGGEGGDVDAVRVAQPRQDGGIDAEDDAVVDGEALDDGALEVIDRDVRAAHQLCDGALVPGAHGVDDVEAVADESWRDRVRVDRGVLRRAAAEDPIPAVAERQRRVRHPAVRAGVAEADQRPDLTRVVRVDADRATAVTG